MKTTINSFENPPKNCNYRNVAITVYTSIQALYRRIYNVIKSSYNVVISYTTSYYPSVAVIVQYIRLSRRYTYVHITLLKPHISYITSYYRSDAAVTAALPQLPHRYRSVAAILPHLLNMQPAKGAVFRGEICLLSRYLRRTFVFTCSDCKAQ